MDRMDMDKKISRTDEKRYEGYLKAELEAAAVYSALADTEADPQRARIFNELVEAELRHASRWAGKLGRGTTGLAPSALGVKGRLIKIAAGLFGTNRVLPILLRGEDKDIDMYAADPEAVDLVPEEQAHARILDEMRRTRGLGETHSRGVAASGGSLRAAVLGANDGLISNFSLVMGVAGGTGNPDFVLLAGVAGLLAGAFSMAAGEYVSVRSQRDLYENELRKEQIELSEWPEEEQAELELIYQAKGLSEEDSRRVASKLMADPKVALDTMAREELGLDPSQLGSPVAAALSSFVAFVVGALIPILPYAVGAGDLAFSLSAGFGAFALALAGGVLALLTGVNPVWGSARMLLAGGAAAAVTYGIGRLIGVSVGSLG